MNTLLIASEGYLVCANPLPIAVDGYLNNCGDIVIPPVIPERPTVPGGGGGYSGRSKAKGILEKEKLVDLYKRMDDEEILIIIKSFIECQ